MGRVIGCRTAGEHCEASVVTLCNTNVFPLDGCSQRSRNEPFDSSHGPLDKLHWWNLCQQPKCWLFFDDGQAARSGHEADNNERQGGCRHTDAPHHCWRHWWRLVDRGVILLRRFVNTRMRCSAGILRHFPGALNWTFFGDVYNFTKGSSELLNVIAL